jgi:flagellar hook assembly protein FlgD
MANRGVLKIVIYNRVGDKVLELFNRETEPGLVALAWDGKDTSGHQVASGVYVLYVEQAGEKSRHRVAVIR